MFDVLKQLKPTQAEWAEFKKNEKKYLICDIVGSFVYAIGVYNFTLQADFAPGGVTGLAMIINYIIRDLIPIGALSVLVNIPILFFAIHHLSGIFLIRTFQTLILNAIFLDFVSPLFPVFEIVTGVDNLLAGLAGGAISGIGLGIMYGYGTCTGGSDLIIMSLKQIKPHLPLGQLTLLIDGSILVLGVFVYKDIRAMIYGLIFIVVYTIILDKWLTGLNVGKVVLIISDQVNLIWEKVKVEMKRGGTFFQAAGAYTGSPKKALMVVCSDKEVPELRQYIGEIDPATMTIVMDYTEAIGRGPGFNEYLE